MNKDAQLIAEAYETLLEAKKKLSPAQKKIAQQAPPPDEITGADFKALKGKKKELKENAGLGGVEGRLKEALQEIEGIGYTGDHIDPTAVAKLVAGHEGNWGDSYGPLVQALEVVISNYYEKGIQDS